MEIGYYAVFNYEECKCKDPIKYCISISFPDIPAAISCASSEEEAKEMAKEAMRLVTAFMEVYELPKVSSLDEIELGDDGKAFYISYNTEDYKELGD